MPKTKPSKFNMEVVSQFDHIRDKLSVITEIDRKYINPAYKTVRAELARIDKEGIQIPRKKLPRSWYKNFDKDLMEAYEIGVVSSKIGKKPNEVREFSQRNSERDLQRGSGSS